MLKRSLMLFALLALAVSRPAAAQKKLGIGAPAPKIEVSKFVKGMPITTLERGKIYVVEFWATWCGPCRVSIPHLTELQKKYKDVTFVGVSVWEQDQKAVEPFVTQMGDKMVYRVAMDRVPAGADGNMGQMAKSWMAAAGQDGIPAAFVINGDGKIAWIGHPMEMEEPLGKIVAGKWDLEKAAQEAQKAEVQQQKIAELRTKLADAQKAGGPKQVLVVIDQVIKDDPTMEPLLAMGKFRLLAGPAVEPEKAVEYGKRLVQTVFKDNATFLNELAWSLVDPDAPKSDKRLVPVALMAAQRADELEQGKSPQVADTLAKTYFDSGDAKKALETQERAVKLAQGTPLANEKGILARLEQYRKAAGK